jgi:FKBP-type peptidyl-prolyl cis-trans isomerase FkpA
VSTAATVYTDDMKRILPLITLLALTVGCGSDTPNGPGPTSTGVFTQTDLVIGTGAVVNSGNRATVIYTGWLYDTSKTDGKGAQFDTGAGFAFVVGAGQVIAGWDRGVPGMRIGGQRRLIIPPELAYGGSSPSASIPPNATLVFDITLTGVQ